MFNYTTNNMPSAQLCCFKPLEAKPYIMLTVLVISNKLAHGTCGIDQSILNVRRSIQECQFYFGTFGN